MPQPSRQLVREHAWRVHQSARHRPTNGVFVTTVTAAESSRGAPSLPSPQAGEGKSKYPPPLAGEGKEGAPRDDSAAVTVVTKTPFVGLRRAL